VQNFKISRGRLGGLPGVVMAPKTRLGLPPGFGKNAGTWITAARGDKMYIMMDFSTGSKESRSLMQSFHPG